MLEDLQEQGMNKILSNIPKEPSLDKEILEAVEGKIGLLKEIVSQRKDLDEINKDPLTLIAYNSIMETLPNVKEFLNQILSYHIYNVEARFSKVILQLCRRLDFKIPPNAIEETGPFSYEPVNFRDIINAGWFYKLAKLSSLLKYDDPKDYLEEYDVINRLTLKGIELSEISSEYSCRKREGETKCAC